MLMHHQSGLGFFLERGLAPLPKIQVMDIGASCINETPIYKILLDGNLAHLNAFEGDTRQVDKIKAMYQDKVTLFSEFLGDGTQQTLYLANPQSGMTSLFKPNMKALQFFNNFENFGRIEKTEIVQTKKLDDILSLPPIDFCKMDIQGSELAVLKNGKRVLKDCLAIQLEVAFYCFYDNQPTFGEVDLWMRENGYIPHQFVDVKRWSITPTIFNNNFRVPGNQLLEADVIYIKNPLEVERLTETQIKKLALLSDACFLSYDLCVYFLLELVRRGVLKAGFQNDYLQSINTMKHSS